jgi:nitrile hydratase subunit alpha
MRKRADALSTGHSSPFPKLQIRSTCHGRMIARPPRARACYSAGVPGGWENRRMAQDHDHDHDADGHHHGSELSEMQLRVRALETVLAEKGYVDPAALDLMIEAYETKIGPHNGARVIAKAWSNETFRQALLTDATKAVRTLGLVNPVGDHLIAVENTPALHNIIVCTLCSCYPWEVLGLPPVWYKSAPYRSRAVNDPRGVLADFGVTLPRDTQIRVWDSTAETRFIVLPIRPAGAEDWSEERLATLVTRDSMIGTGLAKVPSEAA